LLNISSFFLSSRNFTIRLVTGIVLLNLVVIGLAAFAIYADRFEHEERARVTAQNLSLLLEREVGSVLDRLDLGLQVAADEYEELAALGPIDEAGFNAFLKHLQSHLREIISLRVTDANGLVRYGEGLQAGTAVDLSDSEFFIHQRDNPKAGLVIAKPVQARISKEWVIALSRRLNRPGGAFAGIVYVNISVSYFVKKFSVLEMGSHGLVALRSMDHLSMARYPQAEQGGGAVGQSALSDQLRGLLTDNPSSVTYIAPSPTDHIERIYSYNKLKDYPLYVIVGLARQDTLSEWWQNTAQTVALVLLFILMTVLFGWLVSRAWQRQLAVSEALRVSEQRWSLALEGGGFAVWDWNLQTGEVQLSKRGKQLFGFSEDEIGNQMAEWELLCHPDDRAQVLACVKDHFRGRTPSFFVEYRVRCKDGHWKWILTRGLVVDRAADGRPLRMIGTHTDISERHQREDDLRLSAAVFNLADEAMVVTNAQNQILSVNPAFTAITGYAPEEVSGRNPSLLSAKTHPKAFYKAMWAQLIETGNWSGEVLNRKKSGEVYVEWLSIKRVLDDKGKLSNHVAVFSDITARKATEGRIRHLAMHDALTDLPNRSLLTERLEQAIVRAKRGKTGLGLMYFDLDKFKPINDRLGHEVGDLLLKAVAARVVDCVRESDTVARMGGDEFVVLLSSLDGEKDALAVAEKIRIALCQPFHVAGHTLDIAASVGLAIYPEHGSDEETLMRHADAAMYRAKKNGRNLVVLYQAGMKPQAPFGGQTDWQGLDPGMDI
jgi:diguanylate cyclase (GGDEF)-like protein/PAS domain S-box-containing protein